MYHGDRVLGSTVDIKFTTVNTSGVPTTLSGTPSVAAYVDNGTTEITAGITLTADFDGRTGLNNVRVVASAGNGFAAGTEVQLVITAGTVGGSSVVGYVVGTFSIQNRTLTSLDGSADAMDALVAQLTVQTGTAQGGAAGSITLAAGASATNDFYNAMMVLVYSGTGAGQVRVITDYDGGTKVASVSPDWGTSPNGTSLYVVIPTAPASVASGSLPQVDVREWVGSTVATPTTAGVPEVDITHVGGAAEDLPTATALQTAQLDLDLLTGADGAVLATSQPNYAPNTTTPPTAAEVADGILGRNVAGGSDGGRTVSEAMRRLRNKVAIAGGTMTVYEEDDIAPSWTAAVTTAAGDPVSEVDPA